MSDKLGTATTGATKFLGLPSPGGQEAPDELGETPGGSAKLGEGEIVNQAKLVEKWAHMLKRQRPRPDRRDWYDLAVRDEPDGAQSG